MHTNNTSEHYYSIKKVWVLSNELDVMINFPCEATNSLPRIKSIIEGSMNTLENNAISLITMNFEKIVIKKINKLFFAALGDLQIPDKVFQHIFKQINGVIEGYMKKEGRESIYDLKHVLSPVIEACIYNEYIKILMDELPD
ncbi:MAG: hypothetical protein ACTSPL_00030 [Candidatus Odinarchaeia archaeon]